MGEVRVRAARPEDMPLVHQMIHELAEHEGMPDGPKLSVEDLVADGFSSRPAWFFALVAEVGGRAAGYALASRAYSSWTRRALHLEDLYVRPAHRRRGVASRLLQHLCKMGLEEDVHRVDWHVLEGNESAEGFYGRLGARDLLAAEHRRPLRLDRPQIERAAAGLPASTPLPTPSGTTGAML